MHICTGIQYAIRSCPCGLQENVTRGEADRCKLQYFKSIAQDTSIDKESQVDCKSIGKAKMKRQADREAMARAFVFEEE